MLPSKGYFLTINCPFYESGDCVRPHCHFKHSKKPVVEDDEITKKSKTLHNKENENDCKKAFAQPNSPVDATNQAPLLEEVPNISKDVNLQSVSSNIPATQILKRHIPVVYAPAKPSSIFRRNLLKANQYVPVVPDNCPKPVKIDYKPSTNTQVNSESEYKPQSLSSTDCTASYTPSKNILDGRRSPINGYQILDSIEKISQLVFPHRSETFQPVPDVAENDEQSKEFSASDSDFDDINIFQSSPKLADIRNSGNESDTCVKVQETAPPKKICKKKLREQKLLEEKKLLKEKNHSKKKESKNVSDGVHNKDKQDHSIDLEQPKKSKSRPEGKEKTTRTDSHSKKSKESKEKTTDHKHSSSQKSSDLKAHKSKESENSNKSCDKKKHKEKDSSSSHKDKDFLSSHKDKDSSSSHKDKDSSSSIKDSSISHKDKDSSSSHKGKDSSSSHKDKDSSSSHKVKDSSSSHKHSSSSKTKDSSVSKDKDSSSSSKSSKSSKPKQEHSKSKLSSHHHSSSNSKKTSSSKDGFPTKLIKPKEKLSSTKHKSSSHSSKHSSNSSHQKTDKSGQKHTSSSKDESRSHKRTSSNVKLNCESDKKKVKFEHDSWSSSSDIEMIEPENIVINCDSSDDEPESIENSPPTEVQNPCSSKSIQDNSLGLCERWMKAREIINKNPTGKIRIAHVPNVSSLLSAKDRILSSTMMQYQRPQVNVLPDKPGPSKVDPGTPELKAIKRVAHVPKVETKNYPKVMPDNEIKVSTVIRQKSMNSIYDELIKYISPEEAYDKAIEEESDIARRINVTQIYKNSIALLIVRIRKNHGILNDTKPKDQPEPLTSSSVPPFTHGKTVYDCCKKFLLTEEDLTVNGFPQIIDGDPGFAFLNTVDTRLPCIQSGKHRICDNCRIDYTLDDDDMPIMERECIYHWGKIRRVKQYGNVTEIYTCCNQEDQHSGCQVGKYHISNTFDWSRLEGFVSTKPYAFEKNEIYAGIYALDCEMCYTTKGLELARCTVLDINGNITFDKLVRPDNPILDYCTRFSGITEEMMVKARYRLKDVQAKLVKIFSDKTIMIGHSLENDLKVLRLFHTAIVDTAVMYPHKRGFPFKRSLRHLTQLFLSRQIQESESGHDSKEDAQACLDLVFLAIKEDCKSRKPRVIISLPGKQ